MARDKFDALSLAPPSTAGNLRALKAFFADSQAMPKPQKAHICKQLREIIQDKLEVFQTETQWTSFFRKLARLDLRQTILVRKSICDILNESFKVDTSEALGLGGNAMVNKQEMQNQGMEREIRSVLAIRLPPILRDKKRILERRKTLALFRKIAIKHSVSGSSEISPVESNYSSPAHEQSASVGAALEQLEATSAAIGVAIVIPVRTYPSLASYYTRIKFVYKDEDGKTGGRENKGLRVPLAETYTFERHVKSKQPLNKGKEVATKNQETMNESLGEPSFDEDSVAEPQVQASRSSRCPTHKSPQKFRQKTPKKDWPLARFVKEKNFAEFSRAMADEAQDGDDDYAPNMPQKKKARVTRGSTPSETRSINKSRAVRLNSDQILLHPMTKAIFRRN